MNSTKPNFEIKILVIDDDEDSLNNVSLSLKSADLVQLELCCSAQDAIDKIKNNDFHIAITDLKLPGKSGLDIISEVKPLKPNLKFLLITGYSKEENILESLRLGVDEYLKKPYVEKEFQAAIAKLIKIVELENENERLRQKIEKENVLLKKEISKRIDLDTQHILIGESKQFLNTLKKAKQAAKYDSNILLQGETGTGKEILARYIHNISRRKEKPFVPVNCAELSPSLFESELFGHEKGSYTNASESKAGLFEVADGGILFLDEISEIHPDLQAKLLRVVENKKIRRIGSSKYISVDVQLISSTNRNLNRILETEYIRRDLYYRLAEIEIMLPPLRERKSDIPILIDHFSTKFHKQYDLNTPEIPKELMEKLTNNFWEGNIRQLQNFIRKWAMFGEHLELTDVEMWLNNGFHDEHDGMVFKFNEGTFQEIEDAKKWLIHKTIKRFNGNKTKAAEHLGISYPGLLKMLKSKDS
ncbi:MAG: sigma-54 dependent transcriptional regulator [Melioribacteraceae bacterium]|nr:sigma-54 dependent transcriptional regulator [Melioribacteraceae bacterium]MCF8396387.1 sigma-54 dependent transcriptional regulator [Melioribacteraceae bacterium]